MAKDRILSQSKALYVTKTGVLNNQGIAVAGDEVSGVEATQLQRIDNFSFDVDIAGARTDVRTFGQLPRMATIVNSDLTANASIGYLLTDGENEHHLGFEITDSIVGDPFAGFNQAISGMISENSDYRERNLFAVTVAEGEDAFSQDAWSDRSEHDVVGLGNSFVTDYSLEISVGEIPRVDVTLEASNLVYYTGTSSGLYNPSINPANGGMVDTGQIALPVPSTGNSTVDVVRAEQVVLDLQSETALGVGGADLATIHPQSVSLSVPLGRENLQEIGKEFAYAKPLTFPIDVTVAVSAIASNQSAGSIATLLTGCAGQEKRDISVKLLDRCGSETLKFGYLLKNAVLDSSSNSQDLEGNETVDLQFSAQIGGATSTSEGVFFTGAYDTSLGSPLSPTLVTGLVGE
jgi:hypothetical protein